MCENSFAKMRPFRALLTSGDQSIDLNRNLKPPFAGTVLVLSNGVFVFVASILLFEIIVVFLRK